MSLYFLDSSTLVKRYVTEVGTAWVQAVTSPQANHRLLITRITWVEVLSALARRQREGTLSPENATRLVQAFRYDLDTQYQVVELDRDVAEMAGELVRKHVLRAYDAVQLAASLRVQAALTSPQVLFVSADNRLVGTAQAEGLLTDNPHHHS